MHALIEKRRADIATLCERYGVRRLAIFGSAARSDDFDDAASDADFLVEFAPGSDLPALQQFFGLRDDLSALLGRPVDLIEASAVTNPYVLSSINRAREVVYGA